MGVVGKMKYITLAVVQHFPTGGNVREHFQ